ncbi:MAG: histidine kinase dimerization/phosphoacceptor domain -containing protein, partial [Caulobacteraceae bacterium]
MASSEAPAAVEELGHSPELANALGSALGEALGDDIGRDRYKRILDAAPIAIAVAELHPSERIIYANDEFHRITGRTNLLGGSWEALAGAATDGSGRSLAESAASEEDYLGSFAVPAGESAVIVDAWSSLIDDDKGPNFRLVALVEAADRPSSVLEELEDRIREKDTQLRELQHRVKNNLQMITALIRAEAKGVSDLTTGEGFERLAGRVEA